MRSPQVLVLIRFGLDPKKSRSKKFHKKKEQPVVDPFLFVSSKLVCSNDFGSSETKIMRKNQKLFE